MAIERFFIIVFFDLNKGPKNLKILTESTIDNLRPMSTHDDDGIKISDYIEYRTTMAYILQLKIEIERLKNEL